MEASPVAHFETPVRGAPLGKNSELKSQPAKEALRELEFPAADEILQQVAAPDSLRGKSQRARRRPGKRGRAGKLSQVYTVEIRNDRIVGHGRKDGAKRRVNFAAAPFGVRAGHLQEKIAQRTARADLRELQLFNGELVHDEIAFCVNAAQEFTRRWRRSRLLRVPQQSRQQALQPIRTRARTDPAIQIGGIEMVRMQAEAPARITVGIGQAGLRNLSGPGGPESIDVGLIERGAGRCSNRDELLSTATVDSSLRDLKRSFG